MQCKYERSIETRSCNPYCHGKSINIKYYEFLCVCVCVCVCVALIIQHAKRMRCFKLSAVACMSLLCFYTLCHIKCTIFWKSYYR